MKNRFASVILFLLAIPTPALAQESRPRTPRAITIDDFFQIRDVSQPEISPDGQWIAYAVRTRMLKEDKNEQRLWMISTHGGDAVRLTDTVQGVDDFEWSPDSTRLVLILRDPKPEDLEAAKNKEKPAPATPPKPKTPPPVVIDRLQFKRDTVGYLDRRRTHLYVFNVAAKTATQITSGDFDDNEPAWSPDGKSLAFSSNRSSDPDANYEAHIWVVAADNTDKGAHLTQVSPNPGPDSAPTWSPDGKWIAYVTELDPHLFYYNTRHLAVIPASGGQPNVLTRSFDRSIRRLRFSNDSKYIYFTAEDDGTQNLCRIPVGGGEITRPIGGRLAVGTYSLGKDDSIAEQIGTIDRPDEIFYLSNGANEPTRLTKTNDALFEQLRLAQADYVHFKSKDGTTVAGYLYKPLDYTPGKKVPTLLNPHGGPVGQYAAAFYHLAQLYAANGYAVLLPNPRGSSGYGQKFCAAIYADWGNRDYQDDVAMVDYAVAQGIADPDRLGVGGWSYGGISTDFIIGQTTRFKAAISGAGAAEFTSLYGHDQYQRDYFTELGYPWENRALWEKLAPFYKVKNITTPTLFMGGNVDWNVPVLGGEQMYQAMKTLGRTTELVVYPGEYHGFTVPSHIKDRMERFMAWYNHYVKGDSAPATPTQPEIKTAGGK